MQITITKVVPTTKANCLFFDTLLESEGLAVVLTGWKVYDGRLYPPGKKADKRYFPLFYSSGSFCKAVWDAFGALGIEGAEMDEDGWVSAKWGLSNLRSIMGDENGAELHAKYKAGGKA